MAIQYSIQKMVSDGTLSTVALGIQYLQRNDIYIRIAGEETPQVGAPSGYTWSFINNTTLKILPVVPNGVEVVVYRRTDVDALYNIYSQNAQFDEATIDENNQQLLYIAQEYLEQGLPGAGVYIIEYVRDDGSFTYYRIKRTDGSYSEEFAVPSASSSTKVLAREALRRSYAEAGYNLVDGSFEEGVTVTTATDVLLHEATGVAYAYSGTLPHTIGVGETPIGNPLWGDQSLSIFGRNIKDVVHAIGKSAKSIPPDYNLPLINQFTYTNGSFAAGNALGKATKAGQTIAIGPEALGNTLISFENIGIGEVALQNVQSLSDEYTGAGTAGTRNIGIGGNAMQFLSDGFNNVAIGRNAGTGLVNSTYVTCIGAGSLFGLNVNGWYGYVENFAPNNNANTLLTALGTYTGNLYQGINLTAVGSYAGRNLKTGVANTLIGVNAGRDLEIDLGVYGLAKTVLPGETVMSNYVKTGSNIVVTCPGHGGAVGGYANVFWRNDGGPAYAKHGHAWPQQILAVAGDTFTVACPYPTDGVGTCRVYWTTTASAGPSASSYTLIGNAAGQALKRGNNAIAIGASALIAATSADSCVVIGKDAFRTTLTSATTVAIGTSALKDNPAANDCTAVGHSAGLVMQDGTTPVGTLQNSAMFGSNSRVSGDNQVQLGNSATTTYVYGTVQNRSDERDKADLVPTTIGDDFIDGLVAEEGRWDMRDDYQEEYEEEVGVDEEGNPIFETRVRQLPKDGSKKRSRKHQWFVAQKVKALCDELGVDFGGFQDHSVNGGCDVLSLGYDEFIPPLTAYVQRRKVELRELESVVAQQQAAIKSLTERLTTLEGEQ